ncbi:signal peptidase I [Actinoplanes sp. NPDC051861]|uniref:signal peptidase I n=1 Tax=Actinoplanes sp. NPDC051861 TaxID=3155170 RepID=UPI003433217E
MLAFLAGAVSIAVVVTRLRYTQVEVVGGSMAPTLRPGDLVLVRRVAGRRVRTGDLVVIERPDDAGGWSTPPGRRARGRRWLVKRVVATPGERVPDGLMSAVPDGPVPPGSLLVLGDVTHSLDSRQLGYLPLDRVLGVVRRKMQ